MPRCKICRNPFEYAFNKFEKVCGEKACKLAYVPILMEEIKKKEQKAWNQRKKGLRIEVPKKSNTQKLQEEINRLSRVIDSKYHYNCIDCGKPFGKQVDASHFHNVGSHQAARFNLHNVHSSKSDCNQYHAGRKETYIIGLHERYGYEYAIFVRDELKLIEHPKLSDQDKIEKIALIRRILREIDEVLPFINGKVARDYYNGLIGIY
jgi:hypothetical protein